MLISILLKLTYRFNIVTKSHQVFYRNLLLVLKFIWKYKETKIAKTILPKDYPIPRPTIKLYKSEKCIIILEYKYKSMEQNGVQRDPQIWSADFNSRCQSNLKGKEMLQEQLDIHRRKKMNCDTIHKN